MAKVRPSNLFLLPLDLFLARAKERNIDLLLPEIWSKTVNKNIKRPIWRSFNFIKTYNFEKCGRPQ